MNFRAEGAKNRVFSESEGILVGKSREIFGSFEVGEGALPKTHPICLKGSPNLVLIFYQILTLFLYRWEGGS